MNKELMQIMYEQKITDAIKTCYNYQLFFTDYMTFFGLYSAGKILEIDVTNLAVALIYAEVKVDNEMEELLIINSRKTIIDNLEDAVSLTYERK